MLRKLIIKPHPATPDATRARSTSLPSPRCR